MMRTTKSSIRSSSRSTDAMNRAKSNADARPRKGAAAVSGIPKAIPEVKALKGVSNRALLSGIRKLSETERKTVLSILVHLIEIDRRKLYLPLGFSSLYEFCTERLGYSESTAGRRISIARCIRDYPAVYGALSCGKVSMTNLAMIARIMTPENVSDLLCRIEGASKREVELLVSSRRPKSAIRDRVTPVYVKTLLEVRDGACMSDGDKTGDRKSDGDKTNDGNSFRDNTLDGGGKFSTATGGGKDPATSKGSRAGSGEGPAASPDTGSRPFAAQTVVFEERLKVTFGADPDFMRKVERVRSLLSSKYHRHLELGELFSLLMDEYIERHSPEGRIRRKEKREKRAERKSKGNPGTCKPAGASKKTKRSSATCGAKRHEKNSGNAAGGSKRHERLSDIASGDPRKKEVSRHIPRKVRDEVYARDRGRCSFVSPGGRRCGSTWDLQIDHKVPFARGGDNSPENLRLLCGKHNRLEAERTYGKKHMEQYVKEPPGQYAREPVGWYLKEQTGQNVMEPVGWH